MPTQGAELHGEAEVVDHAAANGDLLQVRLGQREVFAQAFRIEGFWQPLLSRTILLDSGLVLQTPGPNMPRETKPAETGAEVSKRLESLKHLLWHGNTEEALERLGDLLMELSFIQARSSTAKKVVDGLDDFRTYICNNREFIPNFGERRRQGETISTAFVESTINQVVSRRFVKKQQMQWTLRGAHLLLQTRTRVLNEDLDDLFRRWYPKFRSQPQTQEPERKAA